MGFDYLRTARDVWGRHVLELTPAQRGYLRELVALKRLEEQLEAEAYERARTG